MAVGWTRGRMAKERFSTAGTGGNEELWYGTGRYERVGTALDFFDGGLKPRSFFLRSG
ncbi:MAG: hypothetical protein WC379_06670 [Methanoregula sp.]